MTKSRVVTAGIVASVLLVAPVPSAFADGPRWSKGASQHGSAYHGGGYRGPAWHGGGSYRGPAWNGGGGYWRGGIWWPFAAVGAVVGTAAAIVAAPFVAFGNAVANAPYYAPQPQYYAPQQQYYAPQGYNAQPSYGDATPPPDYSSQQAPPQYYNNSRPPQGYAPPPQRSYSPPPTYGAPANYPPVTTTYQRPPNPAPVYYSYNYPR